MRSLNSGAKHAIKPSHTLSGAFSLVFYKDHQPVNNMHCNNCYCFAIVVAVVSVMN